MDPTLLVLDVKEKTAGSAKPPSFPTPASSSTGFPEHRKRTRVSAFKQQRKPPAELKSDREEHASPPPPPSQTPADGARGVGLLAQERDTIDKENQARVESMSQAQIEDARQELLSGLDPSVLQMLLKRAHIDDDPSTRSDADEPTEPVPPPETRRRPFPTVADEEHQEEERRGEETQGEKRQEQRPVAGASGKPTKKVAFDIDDAAPPPEELLSGNLSPLAQTRPSGGGGGGSGGSTHFPSAPRVPDLDPADPDFLANLHAKYFPELPADPSRLAWMAPLPTAGSEADRDSPYHPAQESLPVSALRFDFRGALLPPRISRSVPMTHGLHHHGEAPEAAGYTVTELARLARSAVPGQRCIAFQTLGRILYRLGRGEWGVGQGGRDGDEDDLAFSLWRLVRQGRVIESLEEAAGVEEGVGHRSARAYAIEALWLLEKGGWKERWRGL